MPDNSLYPQDALPIVGHMVTVPAEPVRFRFAIEEFAVARMAIINPLPPAQVPS